MDQDAIFLSRKELEFFTGAIHRSHICAHLEMRGICYDLNRKMEVIVLREEVKRFLSGNGGPSRNGLKGGGSKGKRLNF